MMADIEQSTDASPVIAASVARLDAAIAASVEAVQAAADELVAAFRERVKKIASGETK
jgi:hypothetical protein